MVQRKVPNKLGIQADHVKAEKPGNLRPSSPSHQDGKNRGAELKKKMKKSRSIKRSDLESSRSPTIRRGVQLPGKPPPLDVPASAATPQKQPSIIRGSYASPNYLKSTSSFDARKECSHVSYRSSQTSNGSKKPQKISNNSKLGLVCGHKSGKTLTRSSSLKIVRTLTKSPSFKPSKASTRKRSQVVLCGSLDAQRATCSSTLKDSKFPAYLALSPGATESEGTSAMKVCPYTYCSLNGHHHAPLPPLKGFLSARRRILKTQKSMKLGCLSPCRSKPSGDGKKEITEQIAIIGKPPIKELDSNVPAINALTQADQMDFFIEIYFRDMEAAAETTGRTKQNGDGQDEINFAATDFMPSVSASNETAAEHDSGPVVESFSAEAPAVVENFSDEALLCETDFEDDLGNSSEVHSTEMEAAEEEYSPSSTLEEETPEYSGNQSYMEVESPASTELDEIESETSEMDWEEAQNSALSLDDEVGKSAQSNNEYAFESGSSLGDDSLSFQNESIIKSDDNLRSYFDKIPADEGLEEFFEEEGEISGCSYQNLGSNESNQNNQVSPNDELQETTLEKRDGNAKSDDFVASAITLAPIEEPIEQAAEASDEILEADNKNPRTNLQLRDDKKESATKIKDEALIDHHNQYLQDTEASDLLGNEFDPSHTESCHDETHGNYSSSDDTEGAPREEAFYESLLTINKDPETNQNLKQELSAAVVGDKTEEEKQKGAAESPIRIPSSDLLQGLSEADQGMTKEHNNEIQLGSTAKDGEPNQAFVNEVFPAETQVHPSNKQSQTCKMSDSIDSEEQTHSGLNKVSVAEKSNDNVNEMEAAYSTTLDPEEIPPSSENAASTQAKIAFFRSGCHPSQELPEAPNIIRINRRKRPVEELEEPRQFNPREPNYLPIEPDPDAEKVDLRHQMMDERKNTEEWMLDYALQQTVTKLAPARKRKVALLVEAFEKVMPIPKYKPNLRQTSAAVAHARTIQACS